MAKLCASAGRGGMVVWAQGKAGSSVGHAPTPCASLARRLLIVFHEELISDPQGVMRATHSFLHLAASRSHARRTRHRASAEDTMLRASGAQLFNVTAATATSLRQMMSDSVAKVHHQLQTVCKQREWCTMPPAGGHGYLVVCQAAGSSYTHR